MIGRASVAVSAGASKVVSVKLNGTGRRALAKAHRLKVTVAVTLNGATVSSRSLTVTAAEKKKK